MKSLLSYDLGSTCLGQDYHGLLREVPNIMILESTIIMAVIEKEQKREKTWGTIKIILCNSQILYLYYNRI